MGLKEIKNNYFNENIAVTVLLMLKDFELIDRIKYVISDNVISNDLAVNTLYKELKLINLTALCLRCLKHVINLFIKAFLYKNNERSFDFEINKVLIMKFEIR
jgi:hypothetical protein